jgi:Sulfotransferase family
MGSERKANLFVVGAMRAGTTSFMELLRQHPEVYVSPIKEPHYFTETLPKAIFEPQPKDFLEKYFKKEYPKRIHRAHIKKLSDYHKLFENATIEKYRAEGSVSYLHAPGVAEKIKRYNPDAKIIVITRDPLQRALSHYHMDKGLFREKRSFEDVMKAEIEAYENGKLAWYSPLAMSFYSTSIKSYKCHFENAVLVVSFENLVLKPKKTLADISTFLNIPILEKPLFPKLNKGKKLRFKNYLSVLYAIKLVPNSKRILPEIIKIWAKRILLSDNKETIIISSELSKVLQSIFKKES